MARWNFTSSKFIGQDIAAGEGRIWRPQLGVEQKGDGLKNRPVLTRTEAAAWMDVDHTAGIQFTPAIFLNER